ncbi:fused MFS/spermidine synthase, partial [Candidatus Gracilibacteria bacterium]|nr:fused MFS/spermidine synthase [Candidatus Gracilibacteria bacterium]
MASKDRFLLVVVFLAGVGTLGIEMVMPRLLAPFFGTSQPIWAVVIGTTLLYLAIGYQLGGRLADRFPNERVLYRLIILAGFVCAFVPLLSRPILQFAQFALRNVVAGGFIGALLAAVLLFAAPVILMATVGPFAIRLRLKQAAEGVEAAGRTAGAVSAISTVGSIVGTFLTVLVLIPTIGTQLTIYSMAVFLLLLGIIGLRDWRYLALLGVVAALAFFTLSDQRQIKAADCTNCTLIAEAESAYNYIQVAQQDIVYSNGVEDPRSVLLLNEGLALHSIDRRKFAVTGDPLDLLTDGGPWDYFAVAPYFYPERDPTSVRSLAMLGAGAGTVPKQMLAIYGADMQIAGVEIDPHILELGRSYFDVEAGEPGYPNYRVYGQDARAWLASTEQTYDIIGVDAYHQPYIPFHLTTVEFFREVRTHLNPDGVAVVNAARSPGGDGRWCMQLATTMRSVFPQVFMLDTRSTHGASNVILVGINRPVGT